MACETLVGVKNILLTFRNCDTDEVLGPISHKLSSDEIPTWKTCEWNNEALPGGYVKRTASNAGVEFKVIRDKRVPMSYYQGCAQVNLQIEYSNGLVYTGVEGGVLGDEKSDTHEVSLDIAFRIIDELLPPGALAA